MKHLKTIIIFILLIWIAGLYFTFTPSFLWYTYFFISTVAVILSVVLIIYLKPNVYYEFEELFSKLFKKNPTHYITDDDEEDYYMIPQERQRKKKKKKRKKKKRRKIYDITSFRQRKDTHSDYIIVNTSSANMRHKEYLHTTIPDIQRGDNQEILFDTILNLKESGFFTTVYAGLSDDDLINNYNEYKNRRIFELYDNVIPNAYAKVLYDPRTNDNRLSILIPNNYNREADYMLGFISIEDSYNADLLINKYTNIQVIPTILGGAYKQVCKDENNDIYIKTGFTPYSLTVSLAFYNL